VTRREFIALHNVDGSLSMQCGFHLYIDEAGDAGIDQVRPLDPKGASEYFVLSGVLVRSHRRAELAAAVQAAKLKVGIEPHRELHFRYLSQEAQILVIDELAKFTVGLVAVVSNKRNMRGYRNRRVEAKHYEVKKGGRVKPQNYNWFYNHTFRYLLESASAECAKWTNQAYGGSRSIKIVFSQRKDFRYSQTSAYLHKLCVERHGRDYFNNKRQIEWSVVDPSAIESLRAKGEPGLQFADCVASAIFKAVDADWFGDAAPHFLERLAPRFLGRGRTAFGYGFKLLPDGFAGPLCREQEQGLMAVGYRPRSLTLGQASHTKL
jgi:hypothetical protein